MSGGTDDANYDLYVDGATGNLITANGITVGSDTIIGGGLTIGSDSVATSGSGELSLGPASGGKLTIGNSGGGSEVVLDGISGINYIASGNLGIGTTAPAYALDVKAEGTGIIARFNSNNNTSCTLATNGALSCTSDRSLKKNIEDVGYGLAEVMKLNPVAFNWNFDSSGTEKSLGFIAQDVQGVIPDLVTTDQNGLLTLNTIGMIPVLTHAIQQISGYIGPVSSGDLSGFVLGIQAETPRDPVAVIGAKISGGTQFLTNLIVGRITAIRGYFDEIFAKKVHTDEICLKKSDGSETCMNGDQLEKLIPSATPISTPSASSVETPTASPSPVATVEPIASPSATPAI